MLVEWADPTKIPVDKIAEEWRSQSSKGRYESAMWREAGLEEPGASAANGGGIDRNVDVAEADVDNLNAGGFFARYGREPHNVALLPQGPDSTMALTGVSGPVVVDGESFLDALFASAGQG